MLPFEFEYVLVSLGKIKTFNFHMWQSLKGEVMKRKIWKGSSTWSCQVGEHTISNAKPAIPTPIYYH
jgi:hypothetical protein